MKLESGVGAEIKRVPRGRAVMEEGTGRRRETWRSSVQPDEDSPYSGDNGEPL